MSAPSFLDLLALLLGIVAAGHALLYKRRPQSAFGWIAVCLLVPFAGALLYWLFGINRVRMRARKLRSGQPPPDPLELTAVRPPAELEALARLGFAVTGMPLVGGNRLDDAARRRASVSGDARKRFGAHAVAFICRRTSSITTRSVENSLLR